MNRILIWVAIIALICLIAALAVSGLVSCGDVGDSLRSFDEDVHSATSSLATLSVQNKGRIKPLDSLAREKIQDIFGERTFDGLNPTLVLLSWALRPDDWSPKPIIKLESGASKDLLEFSEFQSATHISPDELSERLPSGRGGMAMIHGGSKYLRRLQRRLMLFKALQGDLRIFPRPGSDGWMKLGSDESYEIAGAREAYELLSGSLENLDRAGYTEAARRLYGAVPMAESELFAPRWRIILEVYSNRLGTFWVLAFLYLAISLTYAVGQVIGRESLLRVAQIALYPTCVVHLIAIVARGIIAEKVMASNSYEYILVMTFVTAIGSMVLTSRFKQPVYSLIGAVLSGVGLTATLLSPLSETVSQLPPVLKSSWMTIHVGAAALSYGVLYLAFGTSIAFLLVRERHLPGLRSELFSTNLRLIRLGFFLLGLGIITGAIWADRAWGRYWGWDPKESWSLITWLIYGIYLHLVLCLSKKRHRTILVVVAVLGFVAVFFTFIGVNYLLSGLHSYG
ncbi:MAG: cytochrome c biogenesis protein CcsA [Candidatus Coatesbacteria bacterium]|nr:cytochrome c biogenesis protein CcsA [Candidatus Coatesbacteria bacterium]